VFASAKGFLGFMDLSHFLGRLALLAGALCATFGLGCGGDLTSPSGAISGGPGSKILKIGGDAGQQVDGGLGGAGGMGGAAGPPPIAAQCAACEKQNCTTQAFIDANGEDFYGDCYMAQGNAAQGPAMGLPKSQLCAAVVDCVHDTGCAENANGLSTLDDCYCGKGVSSADCLAVRNAAKGPCKMEIENGAESTDPVQVTMHYLDPGYATGAAVSLIYLCDTTDGSPFGRGVGSPCAASCTVLSAAGGASDSGGAAGASGSGGIGGAAGGSTIGSGGAGTAGTSGSGGTIGVGTLSPQCQECELGSDSNQCLPSYLTAQLDSSGDPIAGTFGCSTLASPAAQAACNALVACIVTKNCSTNGTGTAPGDNPVEGCYCGPAPETSTNCLTGTGVTGPCITEYHNAAIAEGKVAAGQPEGVFAAYISQAAFSPTVSAISLADSIVDCAIDSPCAECLTLVTPGAGGAGGSSGGAGSSGSGSGGQGASAGSGAAGGMGGAGGLGGRGSSGAAGTTAGTGGSATGATGTAGTHGAAGVTGTAGTIGTAGTTGTAGTIGAAGAAGAGQTAGTSGSAGTGGTGGPPPPPACPDLDHDGVRDCMQTLAANAGFDQSAAEWTPEPDTTATWTSVDGVGNPRSGSLEVDNVDVASGDINGLVTAGAFQCIPVTAGSRYEVAVQAYLASGQGSGWAGFVVRFYFADDCTGPTTGFDFLSGQGTALDGWQTIAGTTMQVPLGITSIAVRLVAVKPIAQPSLSVSFDNILVRVE
jgi:hypothetical protein